MKLFWVFVGLMIDDGSGVPLKGLFLLGDYRLKPRRREGGGDPLNALVGVLPWGVFWLWQKPHLEKIFLSRTLFFAGFVP